RGRDPSTVPWRASSPPVAADLAECCRRNLRHTTHRHHFPERVIITRPHHPFYGQSLEVLRQARMPAGLQFVLILPDGSKSLVPAEWTDFNTPISPPPVIELLGSQQHLLCLHSLVDFLLRRAADAPITSGAAQESHAATASELHRHPLSGNAPVGATRRRRQADRHRDSSAASCPNNATPAPGADR